MSQPEHQQVSAENLLSAGNELYERAATRGPQRPMFYDTNSEVKPDPYRPLH